MAVTGGYMHRFFLFEPCCKIEREKIFATLSVAFLFLRFDLQQIRCILDRSKNFATVFLRPLNHYKIFRVLNPAMDANWKRVRPAFRCSSNKFSDGSGIQLSEASKI